MLTKPQVSNATSDLFASGEAMKKIAIQEITCEANQMVALAAASQALRTADVCERLDILIERFDTVIELLRPKSTVPTGGSPPE